MLWVVTETESLQITRCNTFEKEGKFQVWVERSNGKTFMLKQADNKEAIQEIKDMIDTAIAMKDPMLDLKGVL
jgi:hypothetical protein